MNLQNVMENSIFSFLRTSQENVNSLIDANSTGNIWKLCNDFKNLYTGELSSKNNFEGFALINTDIAIEIVFYLNASEICSLRSCAKFTDVIFHLAGERYWQFICEKDFSVPRLVEDKQSKFYTQYIYFHLLQLENEIKHFKSLINNYDALNIAFSSSNNILGVYGMVCDLFWTDNELIALVLSKNRSFALPTIIVDNEKNVLEFKRLSSNLAVRTGQASFLPLSAAALGITEFSDAVRNYRSIKSLSPSIPGFIGFAIDLLNTCIQYEHIKFCSLFILFKNVIVFDTMMNMNLYSNTLNITEFNEFRGIALDSYSEEELSTTYPRFAFKPPRSAHCRYNYDKASGYQMVNQLTTQYDNTRTSHAIIQYSY